MEHFTDVTDPKSYFIADTIKAVNEKEARLKKMYKEHNENVIAKVPSDRLLVWNVKDGWEPLCDFLGKDLPTEAKFEIMKKTQKLT